MTGKGDRDRAYLREWRLAKGLNQPELAKRAGTVKSEISRLERGSRKMTLEWMSRFSRALGISVEDLMTVPPMGFGAVSPPPSFRGEGADANFVVSHLGEMLIGVKDGAYGIASVTGDDWSGTFQPGDLLIYDKSKRSIAVPGVFAIELEGEVIIRRLHADDDGVVMTCANKDYQPIKLTDGMTVLGRVAARVHRI